MLPTGTLFEMTRGMSIFVNDVVSYCLFREHRYTNSQYCCVASTFRISFVPYFRQATPELELGRLNSEYNVVVKRLALFDIVINV